MIPALVGIGATGFTVSRCVRRLGYILAALLALGGSVRADQGWSDTQNTNGFVAQQSPADCAMQSFYDGTIGCAPAVSAPWDPSVFRVYAIDYDAGNDTHVGYATAASSSLADFEAADAFAGAHALKTMQGLGNIIPRQGAGRKIAIIIASRSGGANYLKQDGVTVDSLDSFMSGLLGYSRIVIWATGTNSTCGATKFTGDAADFTCAGAIPVTGTNASGYNPTAGATTTAVPCTKVGGGAPGLAAEPAAPLGYSTRYDSATATAALRNVARGTQIVSTTSTTNDTVSPQVAWPATPGTSDVFYLEQPGVVCAGWGASWDASSQVDIVGIRSTSLVNYAPGPSDVGHLNHMFDGFGGSTALGTGATGIRALSAIISATGVGTITRGSTIHIAGSVIFQPTTFFQLDSVVTEGQTLVEFTAAGFEDLGSVMGGNVTLQGNGGALVQSNPILGNVGGGLPDRVFGHVTIQGGKANLRDVQISGAGGSPAIAVQGTSTVYLNGPSGSTNNTDVGMDLTGAQNAVITINATPTVTGTLGDVRLCDGTIITWAQALAGIIDTCGNQITSAGSAPLTVYPAGTTVASLAGSGTSCVQASSTGLVSRTGSACGSGGGSVTSVTGTAQRISVVNPTTTPVVDTIGGFYSGAVSGGNEDLGTTLTNGLVCNDTTAGVAVLRTCVSATDYPAVGVATPGSCTNCSATINGNGQVTTYASGTAPVTSIGVTDPITTTGGATPTIGAKFDNVSITLNGGGGLQRAAISGDGTIAAGANTFALTNIPNGTTAAGDINFTAISAPSTPAAGHALVYIDSTSKNLAEKNDAGTVNHGAQTQTAAAGKAFTALSDAGAFTETSFQSPLTFSGGTVSTGGTVTLANSSTCGALTAVSGSTTSGLTCSAVVGNAANGIAYFNAIGDLDEDATNFGWNDSTRLMSLGTTSAPTLPPAAGVVYAWTDSTVPQGGIWAEDSTGSITHGMKTQTCAASTWVRQSLNGGGFTCGGVAVSDLSGNLAGDTHGPPTATVTTALTDGAGSPVSWSTAGHAFTAGQVLEAVGGNGIATNTMAALLIGAGVLSRTIPYYIKTAVPGSSSGWLATANSATFSTNATENGLAVALVSDRVIVNVTQNSLSCGGSTAIEFEFSQNGTASPHGVSVNCGASGVFDSGIITLASQGLTGATSDTWGIDALVVNTILAGTIEATIEFIGYY